MNIVIAGAGAVGTHLARLLIKEDQDLIIIDPDIEKVRALENLNLSARVGSPTSIKDLRDAEIKHADLFVAVTPYETENILACSLASHLGAAKTIARIDNAEYLREEYRDYFKRFGIDEMIYPEMVAAEEIEMALKKTWVRQWAELGENGSLLLIAVKVRADAVKLNNVKMKDLKEANELFHIALIKRRDRVIIPKGDDRVLPNDLVYFTTTPDNVDFIRRITNKGEVEIKNIMMMGGSHIARRTIEHLPKNFQLKVFETDDEKIAQLAATLKGIKIFSGDGRDVDLLKEEGIYDTDAFVALTDSSEANILACLTAKEMGVTKTIAEVENLAYISMAENLNIGTVINKKQIAASRIYQMLLSRDVSNVKFLTLVNAEVAELIAKPNSRITQGMIKDLKLPSDMTIGGYTRKGEGHLVNGNTQIEEFDHVYVFCLDTAISKLEKLFG